VHVLKLLQVMHHPVRALQQQDDLPQQQLKHKRRQ
jgi:hypothetical protein